MANLVQKSPRKSPRKNPCPMRRVPVLDEIIDCEMDGNQKDSRPKREVEMVHEENTATVCQMVKEADNSAGCETGVTRTTKSTGDNQCKNKLEKPKRSVEKCSGQGKKDKSKKLQTGTKNKEKKCSAKSSVDDNKECGAKSRTDTQGLVRKQLQKGSKTVCGKGSSDMLGKKTKKSCKASDSSSKVSASKASKQSVTKTAHRNRNHESVTSNGASSKVDNPEVNSGSSDTRSEWQSPPAAAVLAASELAVEDLCRLTAELTALNKDSEKLTTPLHNKQTKRLQDNRSPMKVLQKTPNKKPSSPPRTPSKQVFSPRNKKGRSPARLQVALFTNRTPRKTPRKTPQKGRASQDESGLEMLSPTPSHLSGSPFTPIKIHSPNLGSPLFKTIPTERSTPFEKDKIADMSGTASESEEPAERSMRLLSDTVDRLASRLAAGSPMKPDQPLVAATPQCLKDISPVKPDTSMKMSQLHSGRSLGKEVRFNLSNASSKSDKPRRIKPSRIPTRGGERRDKIGSTIQQKRKRTPNSSDINLMPKDKQRKLELRLSGSGQQSVKRRLLMGEGDSPNMGEESSDETDESIEQSNLTTSTEATFTEKSTLSSLASSFHESDSGAEAASEDNSEEGGMEIIEVDPDLDIFDRQLRRKSEEVKLTATNVKSILRQVITNDAVLDMVRNTIAEEGIEDKLKEAMFEPKMTRSRIKQVLETNGTLPAWPLSPAKVKTKKEAPAFAEMTFNEDESDEDYDPTKEQEHLSDEESVLSSQMSDFGSPASSNISLTPIPRPNITPKQLFREMLGEEPKRGFRPLTSPLQLLSTTPEPSTPGEDDITIALRTRSKMPLDDTPLDIIEANFVAPDITADLYDTCCDNQDWLDFLNSLGKEELNETVDDAESDPEYNFLADAEDEEDVEDYRDDKSVRVTKKELNELMNELFEAELDEEVERILTPQTSTQEMPPPTQTVLAKNKTVKALIEETRKEREKRDKLPEVSQPKRRPMSLTKSPAVTKTPAQVKTHPGVPVFSNEERLQLEDQMRKHTQLLAQTYVMSTSSKDYEVAGDTAKDLLHELKSLGDQSMIPEGCHSAFHSANLDEALDLITWSHPVPNHQRFGEFAQTMRRLFGRKYSSLYKEVLTPTWEQMEQLLHSRALLFPQMLPEGCFLPPERSAIKRNLFSESEDLLLALGYDQFKACGTHKYALQLLQKVTFPHKSMDRLKQRHRSILRSSECTAKDILVGKWQSVKLPRYTELEPESEFVPPKDRDSQLLPRWFKAWEKVLHIEDMQKKRKVDQEQAKAYLERVDKEINVLPHERTAAWAREQQKNTVKKKMLIKLVPGVPKVSQELRPTRFRTFLCVDGSNDSPGDAGSSSPSPPPPPDVPIVIAANPPALPLDASHHSGQSSQPVSPASQSRSSVCSPVSVPPFEVCTPLHSPVPSIASCSSPATVANDGSAATPVAADPSLATVATPASTVGTTSTVVASVGTDPALGSGAGTNPIPSTVTSVGSPGLVLQTPVAAPGDDQWVLLPVMPPAGVTFSGPMPTSIRIPASMLTQAARQLMAATPQTGAPTQPTPTAPVVATTPQPLCTNLPKRYTPIAPKPSDTPTPSVSTATPVNTPPVAMMSGGASISTLISADQMTSIGSPVLSVGATQSLSPSVLSVGATQSLSPSVLSVGATQGLSPSVKTSEVGGSPVVAPAVMSQASETEETPEARHLRRSVDEAVRELIGTPTSDITMTPATDTPAGPSSGEALPDPNQISETNKSSVVCTDVPTSRDPAQFSGDPGLQGQGDSQESNESPLSSQQLKSTSSPLKLSKLIRTAWSLADENSTMIGELLGDARSATTSPAPALPPSWLPDGSHDGGSTSAASSIGETQSTNDDNRDSLASNTLPSGTPLVDSRIPTCTADLMPSALASLVAAAGTQDRPLEDSHQPMDLSLCMDDTEPGLVDPKPLPQVSSMLKTPQKLPQQEEFQSPVRPQTQKPPGSALKTPGKLGETPGKSAVEIMATMAQLLTTPPRRNLFNTPPRRLPQPPEESMSSKDSLSSYASSQNDSSCPFSPESTNSASGGFSTPTKQGFSTPTKQRLPTIVITPTKTSPSALYSPKRYPLLAPKHDDSPVKVYSPLKRTPKSPRRKILQQQARAIAPKGLVCVPPYVSPTKKAAANITAKARRRGRPAYLKNTTARNLRSRRSDGHDSEGNCSGDEKENKRLTKSGDVSEDSDEDLGADSQTEGEEDQMAQLQAASTTIGFDPKKRHLDKEAERKKGKAAQRRDTTLRLLDQNLLESDPLRDERDTVFAQAYLLKAKDTLAGDVTRYDGLLKILFDFGKSTSSPVQLYQEVKILLVDYPELVDDFAGFLQPEQALECDCLATHQEFNKAREFLRKLEVCFGRHPSYLQRILRAFAAWQRMPGKRISDLKELVVPLLRGQQHLLDEFTQFFDDEKPPESLMTDFEEVQMLDSDEEEECVREPDEFEEIEIPDGDDELYGTRRCRCLCHGNTQDIKYRLRKKHCIPCGMKVVKGKLYVQTSGKNLRPLRVVFRDNQLLLNGAGSDLEVKDEVMSSEEGDIMATVCADGANKENELEQEQRDKKIRINLSALRSSLQEFVPLDQLVAEAHCETLDVPVSLESVSIGGQPLAVSPSSVSAVTEEAEAGTDIDTGQTVQEDKDKDNTSPNSSNSPDLPQLDGSGSGVKVTARSHQHDHATDGEAESEAKEWSMSEDKLLLETCREKGASPETCKLVSSQLQGRTVKEVECRLQELISMMTSGSTESDVTDGDTETDTDAESTH